MQTEGSLQVELNTRLLAMQFNLKAPKDQRDIGGLMLLQTYTVLKRTWWQCAPRLEQEVPGHPIFLMDFMEEAKFSGIWDRWVQVVTQYHLEVEGLLRAMSGPLWSMIGLATPHLIVARLLEPVHVRFMTGHQRDLQVCTVLLCCLGSCYICTSYAWTCFV